MMKNLFKNQADILKIFLVIWLIFYVKTNLKILTENKDYYQFAIRASFEKLQAYHAVYDQDSYDFYYVLRICQRIIPPHEEVQLILPQPSQHKFEFLREKGRYFLYPLNYGENSLLKKYILVYDVDNFIKPMEYEMVHYFSADKYLMKRITPSFK